MATSPPPDVADASLESLAFTGPDGSLPCAVKLDVFEGPLDLLLHLIRENEVDVHDIPVTAISRYSPATSRFSSRITVRYAMYCSAMAAIGMSWTSTSFSRIRWSRRSRGPSKTSSLIAQGSDPSGPR